LIVAGYFAANERLKSRAILCSAFITPKRTGDDPIPRFPQESHLTQCSFFVQILSELTSGKVLSHVNG
jgi:hypothetical protein